VINSPCPFCTLDDPDVTVWSDALVQAVVSRAPINEYHVIVVPRAHVERLPDLAPEVAAAAVAAAQRVARAIGAAARPDGITYITEDDLTGQGYNLVAHWKLHVIARFRGDAVRLDWARGEDPGPAARALIAAAVRAHVASAA
jgi:histidine triad (HIT) family protein